MKIRAADFRRRLRGHLRALGLGAWDARVRVNRTLDECRDEDHREDAAFTDVEDGYAIARVEVNEYNLGARPDLDELAAHEAAHILLWRLGTLAESAVGEAQRPVAAAILEDCVEALGRALARGGARR